MATEQLRAKLAEVWAQFYYDPEVPLAKLSEEQNRHCYEVADEYLPVIAAELAEQGEMVRRLREALSELVKGVDDWNAAVRKIIWRSVNHEWGGLENARALLAECNTPPAAPAIDTGDVVLHTPTGESWVVAFVEGDHLAWCGWPQGFALLKDCTLAEKATPEARMKLLYELAAMNDKTDCRCCYAKRVLPPAAKEKP